MTRSSLRSAEDFLGKSECRFFSSGGEETALASSFLKETIIFTLANTMNWVLRDFQSIRIFSTGQNLFKDAAKIPVVGPEIYFYFKIEASGCFYYRVAIVRRAWN